MSDLREQLARKLWEINKQPDSASEQWFTPSTVGLLADYEKEPYRRMADEVIRQMRWSRHSYRWANPENMDWNNYMDPTEEPTLAPEDWIPNE